MTDLELFECFNLFIGKKNNHFLWRTTKRIEPRPSMSIDPTAKRQRIRQLTRFYNRYSQLEISPFDQVNR